MKASPATSLRINKPAETRGDSRSGLKTSNMFMVFVLFQCCRARQTCRRLLYYGRKDLSAKGSSMPISFAAVSRYTDRLVRLYLCNFPLLARLLGMLQVFVPSDWPPAGAAPMHGDASGTPKRRMAVLAVRLGLCREQCWHRGSFRRSPRPASGEVLR